MSIQLSTATAADKKPAASCGGRPRELCRNDVESQRLDDDYEFPLLWKRVFQSNVAPSIAQGMV